MRWQLCDRPFPHPSRTTNVSLELDDGSTIEGTAIPPIWSLDRNEGNPLGEVLVGELLQSNPCSIALGSLRVLNYPTSVFNLEVYGDHVYQIDPKGHCL